MNKLIGILSLVLFSYVGTLGQNCYGDGEPLFDQQWGLRNSANLSIDINACDAWNVTLGGGVKIAIVDDGIDPIVADYASNLSSQSYDCRTATSGGGTRYGYHGTFIAGIIASEKNGNNIMGVAPEAKLMNISQPFNGFEYNQSINDGTFARELSDGIIWAADHGADVLNISFGDNLGEFNSPYMNTCDDGTTSCIADAINYALTNGRNGLGTVVVIAAGNKGQVIYPATDVEDAIVVGGIDKSGALFELGNESSAVGSQVDVVAPGFDLLSYYFDPNSLDVRIIDCDLYPELCGGTSYAAPHVAAIAGMILDLNPNLTALEVKEIIESTANQLPNYTYNSDGRNNETGHGLIDAYRALVKVYEDEAESYAPNRCSSGNTVNFDINQSSTWSYIPSRPDYYNINGVITIKSGNTLTINPGVVVRFCNPQSKIIVEPGASLILDGAKLTNNGGQRWGGIEVWGTNNGAMPTTLALNIGAGITPGTFSNTSDQGILIMKNNASIEYANEAFRNHVDGTSYDPSRRGGVIWAHNSMFYNCWRSAEFLKWSGNDLRSRFKNCVFTIDDNFILNASNVSPLNGKTEPLRHFVTMWDVHGVEFFGNTFVNNYTGLVPLNRGEGIRSIDASYHVEQDNKFLNLTYGIKMANDNGNIKNGVFIKDNVFSNVLRGVEVKGSNFGSALNNVFHIPIATTADNASYGMSLYMSNGYSIRDNQFIGDPLNTYQKIMLHTYGIIANTTTYNAGGRIDGNVFSGLAVGFQAQKGNSSLLLSCNEFESTGKAWSINECKGAIVEDERIPVIVGKTLIDRVPQPPCINPTNAFSNQGTGCGVSTGIIQMDNFFLDVNRTHIYSDVAFDYYGNQSAGQVNADNTNLVNVTICNNGTAACSNTRTYDNDEVWLVKQPDEIIKEFSKAKSVRQKQIISELERAYLQKDKVGYLLELLELMGTKEARELLIPAYKARGEYSRARRILEEYEAASEDEKDFKIIHEIELNLLEQEQEIINFVKDDRVYNQVLTIATSEGKYAYVAQRLLEIVGEPSPVSEPVFTGLPGRSSEKEKINYSFEVAPNPGSGNIKAIVDLGDKTTGKIIVKDAITGEPIMEESVTSTEKSKSIDVSPLQNGNYIFELHGDGQYLDALHFMKY